MVRYKDNNDDDDDDNNNDEEKDRMPGFRYARKHFDKLVLPMLREKTLASFYT